MRTRDRLFNVCMSLNPAAVGKANVDVIKMFIRLEMWNEPYDTTRDEIHLISKEHPSPHVRELTAELLALK